MARTAVALLLLGLAYAHAQTYTLDLQQPQKSVPYNPAFNGLQATAEEIPAGDPLVAPPPNLGPYTPWSIHVTLAEQSALTGSVWVTWSTGIPTLVTSPAQLPQTPVPSPNRYADDYPQPPKYNFELQTQDPASVASQVNWGLFSGKYLTAAVGSARSYVQTYFFTGPSYESQLFHHVHVTGIPYGKKIYYQVGDPSKELSGEFSLQLNKSLAVGAKNYPVTVGVMADNGVTYNSSTTYQHAVAHDPDFVIFMGDLAYSDDYSANGLYNGTFPPQPEYALTGVTQGQTYQPHWDSMTQLLQNSGGGSSIPYMFLPGNHEIERDEQLRTFQAYTNRFRSPYEQSYSTNPLWYSLDVGPIHVIMLNGYGGPVPNVTINTNTSAQAAAAETGNSGTPIYPNGNYPYSSFGFDQFNWFLNDIGRVNRAVTPWVIVAWHQPPYNSYSTHYKEFECGRQQIEPYLYANGVDIVLHGHVHAYERTFPVNNYAVDPCGMRYLTVGDGGNIEGLYKTFAAQPGTCTCTSVQSSASANACPCLAVTPSFQPQRCATFQGTDPTGAPLWAPVNAAQPAFSAYREPSFGHGILEILDDTNAQWTWYRNQDGVATYSDTALFQRNTAACPNKLKPNNTPVSTGKAGLIGDAAGLLHPTLPPAVAAHLNNFENNLTNAVDVVVNHVNALNAVAPSPSH